MKKKSLKKVPKKSAKQSLKKNAKKESPPKSPKNKGVSGKVSGKGKTKGNKGLTDKQKVFCQEYLIDLNATQSAIRAGYSEKTARSQAQRLLTKVDIQAEIQNGMNKRSKKIEITADYVLGNLKEIGERCMQRVPVMIRDLDGWIQKTEVNNKGEEVGVWEFQAMGAIKSNELLGKHIKLFTEKVEERVTEKKIFITEKEQAEADKHIDESLKE